MVGIVYQLRTGVPWPLLPTGELGCGSPVTSWRLRDWQWAGVWQQLHHLLLEELSRQGRLGWSRASLDSMSVRASGGCLTGPNPTGRGKPGSKYHLLTDRNGIPLAVCRSAATTHDSMLLEAVVDGVPAVKGPRGRPGRPPERPVKLHRDKAYDDPRCRQALRRRGITRGSPVAASTPASGWATTARWWSDRWLAGGLSAAAGALRAMRRRLDRDLPQIAEPAKV